MTFRTYEGHEWSEAGWRMCDVDECALPIAPLDYLQDMQYLRPAWIRKGAPLTILSAWLRYYDDNIAPIISPVWGWSRDNAVETSNHLAGVALDINAPQWPWGTRRMPADMKARIRRGLGLFEGTIFWGADWDRADEMHFQMGFPEGDSRNDVFAAKLRGGYLGIYGDNSTGLDVLDMTKAELEAIIYNCLKVYVGPIGLDVKANRQQLTGGRDEGEYPGWPQLNGRTLVDAVSEIGQHLGLPGYNPPA